MQLKIRYAKVAHTIKVAIRKLSDKRYHDGMLKTPNVHANFVHDAKLEVLT